MNTLKRMLIALLALTFVVTLGCKSFPKIISLPDGFQPISRLSPTRRPLCPGRSAGISDRVECE